MPTTRKQPVADAKTARGITSRSRKNKRSVELDGLTPKQIQLVEARIKAQIENIPQGVLAQQVYPNQTPASAAVSMSRELKNANVQDALGAALAKHGISVNSVVKVVADGLKARKVIDTVPIYDDELDPITGKSKQVLRRVKKVTIIDHSTRLNAARTAKSFLGLDQDAKDDDNSGGNTFIFNTVNQGSKYVDAQ